jgi:predicted nucleic acid-binding protein
MISLDTNLVLSAINPNDTNHARAVNALVAYSSQAFCLCPVVYTELRASATWPGIELWLTSQGIGVVWDMPDLVWDAAGMAFGQYATLRKAGLIPRRIAADFLIAAHAEHHGLEVLTFDDTVFKAVFPSVRLLAC